MFRNIRAVDCKLETAESYLGLLRHGNTHKLQESVVNLVPALNHKEPLP
jgi:hypothetical protein